MNSRLRPFLAFVLSLLAFGEARAGGFEPNHLFVSSSLGRVFEFEPGGEFVRSIQVAPFGSGLRGLVFGTDGRLYVADMDGDAVYAVDADGTSQRMWDASDGLNDPVGLSLGARGSLGVVSRGTASLVEFTTLLPHSPPHTTTPIPSNASDAVLDATGELVVTSNLPAAVRRLHRSGAVVFSDLSSLGTAGGLGSWYGFLVTTDYAAGEVFLMSPTGLGTPLSHPQIVGPWGIAGSPTGNLAVACFDGDRVVEFAPDNTVVRVFEHPDLVEPSHLAYAPFRFDLKVKTSGFLNGNTPTKAKDANALLQYAPGSGALLLTSDAIPAGLSLSTGDRTLVLRGSRFVPDGKTPVFCGAIHRTDDPIAGRVMARLELLSKTDAIGATVVKKVKGTLEMAGALGTFTAKVKTKK
ncbi:MAG: hypothetical protein ACF8XB_02740 [Planctomycetota bacterium JB042]